MNRWNKNIKIIGNYVLGPVLFVILSWSLYSQISAQEDLSLRWQEIQTSWLNPLLWLSIALMFVNYGIESRKWQILLKRLERISFFRAFKSVLTGCSISILTPNRVGEYGGRIMYVKEEHRIAAIPLNMLGSLSQLTVTIIGGTLGLLALRYFMPSAKAEIYNLLPALAGQVLLILCIAVSLVLVLFYFRIGVLIKLMLKSTFLKKYVKYLHFMHEFSRKELLRILSLSFFRYLVFILQYILLLKVMKVEIPMVLCFWLLTVFYLLITIAPTIGFAELPLRAAASVELLKIYSTNVVGIQAASLSIWIINLVLPAVIGSVLILGLKIIKDR